MPVWCGAGLSAAPLRKLALPTGTASRRPIGTTSMGSVWRGLRNYCLATLLLYCLLLMYLKSIPEGGINSNMMIPKISLRNKDRRQNKFHKNLAFLDNLDSGPIRHRRR